MDLATCSIFGDAEIISFFWRGKKTKTHFHARQIEVQFACLPDADSETRIHSGHRALLGFPTIDPTGAGALRLPLPSGLFFYSFRPSLLLVVRPVMLGGSQRAT